MMKTISLLSVVLAGCAAEVASTDEDQAPQPDQQLDQRDHLLVRVTADHDREVVMREPLAGLIYVTQTGPNGVSPIALSSDPIEAFRTLAPGRAVPDVLVRAVERMNGAAGAPPPLAEAITIDARSSDTLTSHSFPASEFHCFTKNAHFCEYDVPGEVDVSFRTIQNQQLNEVVAGNGGRAVSYIYYATKSDWSDLMGTGLAADDGWWRSLTLTGTFGAQNSLYMYPSGQGRMHFTSAGWQ